MECLCVFPKGQNEYFALFYGFLFVQTSHYYAWYWNTYIKTLTSSNSHFLFLCASMYIGQPLKSQHFFLLNQSLVWGHWHTITWCYSAKSEHPTFNKQTYETDFTNPWHTCQKYFTSDFHFQSLMTLFSPENNALEQIGLSSTEHTTLTLMLTYMSVGK